MTAPKSEQPSKEDIKNIISKVRSTPISSIKLTRVCSANRSATRRLPSSPFFTYNLYYLDVLCQLFWEVLSGGGHVFFFKYMFFVMKSNDHVIQHCVPFSGLQLTFT